MASDNRRSIASRKSLDLDSIMVGIEEYLNDAESQEVEVNIVDDEECEPLSIGDDARDELESLVEVSDGKRCKTLTSTKSLAEEAKDAVEDKAEEFEAQSSDKIAEKVVDALPQKFTEEEKAKNVVEDAAGELKTGKSEEVAKTNAKAAAKEEDPEVEAPLNITEKIVEGLPTEPKKAKGTIEDEADELEAGRKEEVAETNAKAAAKEEDPEVEAPLNITEKIVEGLPTEPKKAKGTIEDEADELEAGKSEKLAVKNLPREAKQEKAEEMVQDEADELEAEKSVKNLPREAKLEKAEETVQDEADELETERCDKVAEKEIESLAKEGDKAKDVVEDEADALEAERCKEIAEKKAECAVEEGGKNLEAEKSLDVAQNNIKSLSTEAKREKADALVEDKADELEAERPLNITEKEADNLRVGELETGKCVTVAAGVTGNLPTELDEGLRPETEKPCKIAPEERENADRIAGDATNGLTGKIGTAGTLAKEGKNAEDPERSADRELACDPPRRQANLKMEPPLPLPTADPTPAPDSAQSALDRETEDLLRELEQTHPQTLSARAYNETLPIYIYTSLAGGGYHMIPRTNRLATILTANRVTFEYRDLGTDPHARSVWKTHAAGKTLPGVVRGTRDVIGDWQDIDDANEQYALRDLLYDTL